VPKVRAFLALATWFYRLYGLLTYWARKTGIVMHMKSIEEVVDGISPLKLRRKK